MLKHPLAVRKCAPLLYNYKPTLDPEQDTVITPKTSNETPGIPIPSSATPKTSKQPKKDIMHGIRPDELIKLTPRLKAYLHHPNPTWPEIIDAVDWLRYDLDVSKSLWGDACLTMGRDLAAIALAIVSTKDPEYFRTTPGGYFHGMVQKAKAGQLHLKRTIWAMRRAAQPNVRLQTRVSEGTDSRRK